MLKFKIEPEKLEAHLKGFEDDLAKVLKALTDSKFETAEHICVSIRSRAEILGLDSLYQHADEFLKVVQLHEPWKAVDHYINKFRLVAFDVIVPLNLSIHRDPLK
jgi:hypothetical protein